MTRSTASVEKEEELELVCNDVGKKSDSLEFIQINSSPTFGP